MIDNSGELALGDDVTGVGRNESEATGDGWKRETGVEQSFTSHALDTKQVILKTFFLTNLLARY